MPVRPHFRVDRIAIALGDQSGNPRRFSDRDICRGSQSRQAGVDHGDFLPILPNRSYFQPPFDVLNPFAIGVFIVMMSAVGFVGFILAKALGAARGIGLMDVDAVSFSMTRLSGTLGEDIAADAVLLAVLSNSLLKGLFALFYGSRDLRRAILPGFALMLAAGCAAAWIGAQ
jgi:uncharacterized membrane protein (DUF4010 family)